MLKDRNFVEINNDTFDEVHKGVAPVATSRDFYQGLLEDIARCVVAIAELRRMIDDRCATTVPASRMAKKRWRT